MNAADELFDWLVDGAPGAKESEDVVARLASGLIAAGVPLDQLSVFVTTLHPTVLGRRFRWKRGEPEVSTFELTVDVQRSNTFTASPVYAVISTKKSFRRKLDASMNDDFEVLVGLKKEGCTDYLAEPLAFTNGELHVATFATRDVDGFTDAQLAVIRHVLRPLSRLAEIFALHRIASNLLSTYVGHDSGEKILAGRIMKGDIELVRAAIWFSDLRGFTEMSSRLTPREIIDTLNELFECQVPAIEKRGGEVLKFIGDGLLGIFPIRKDGDARARCADAIAASEEAFAALDARNTMSRRNPSPPLLRFGLALHVGEFAYGNIGGASRLDFTAIGPAINIAARLEGLTSKLDRDIVFSSDFVETMSTDVIAFTDLGAFDLKGVPDKQKVFGR